MKLRLIKIASIAVLLLGTVLTTVAQAQAEEGGGNAQTPVQVVVQVFLAGVLLKFLQRFDLP